MLSLDHHFTHFIKLMINIETAPLSMMYKMYVSYACYIKLSKVLVLTDYALYINCLHFIKLCTDNGYTHENCFIINIAAFDCI